MTNLIISMLLILSQIIFPTPDWPDLTSPTPFMTMTPAPSPTPHATVAPFSTPLPIASPTSIPFELEDFSLLSQVSTAEALTLEMEDSIIVQGEQIYWDGEPMLPNSNGEFAGYLKWITSPNGAGIFGQFQPILSHIGILFALSIFSLAIFFTPVFIVSLIKIITWAINFIMKFIPGIG